MDVTDYAKKGMKQDLPGSLFPIGNEEQLIKIMLLEFSQDKFSDVVEIITEDDFSSVRCGLAFKVIKQLVNENEPIESYTVGKRLNEISGFNQLENNGINYLAKLTLSEALGSWDWIVNAKEIRRCSMRRQLSRILERAKARNEDPQGESVETTLNNVLSELDAIAERVFTSTKGPKNLTSSYIERYLDIRDRQQNPEKFQNEIIPTGYPAIDQLLAGGFRKGNLIVIGARPGTGKTTLGLNIAERLIFNSTIKEPVLFFSLEMPLNEITDRFMASVANVDHSRIITLKLSEDDHENIIKGFFKLKDDKQDDKQDDKLKDKVRNVIYVDDKSDLKPVEIKARASRFKQQRGLSLIVVDYLQYIQIPGYKSKVEELSQISHDLKGLAKDLNVPVIALAQLNRNSENRSDKRPETADLRGSGSIEQDADIAMFIHRKDPQDQQVAIIISKNRHGPTGTALLTFNGQYSRFED